VVAGDRFFQLPNRSWVQLARRVVLGGRVPSVGPKEELRGPSRHTLKDFILIPGREAK